MRRAIFRVMAVFLLAWIFGPGQGWTADTPKFAYVDVPRAIASSQAAKQARDLLKKKLGVKQKEVDNMEAEIKRMKADLEKRSSSMNNETRTEMSSQIQSKFREYQRLVEDNQGAIDKENGVWTKKITDALREVVETLGKEKGYVAVFGKGQVLYASAAIDITDQILNRLNEFTKNWF